MALPVLPVGVLGHLSDDSRVLGPLTNLLESRPDRAGSGMRFLNIGKPSPGDLDKFLFVAPGSGFGQSTSRCHLQRSRKQKTFISL